MWKQLLGTTKENLQSHSETGKPSKIKYWISKTAESLFKTPTGQKSAGGSIFHVQFSVLLAFTTQKWATWT